MTDRQPDGLPEPRGSSSALMPGLAEPRSLSAGRGWRWIVEGFDYFWGKPAVWLAMIVVFGVAIVMIALVPLGGIAIPVLSTMLIGGMVIGCRAQDQGEGIRFEHLFAGFRVNAKKLAVAGLLYLVVEIVLGIGVAVVVMGLMGGAAGLDALGTGAFNGPPPVLLSGGMLVTGLVLALLTVPVLMAFWFVPTLVALHGIAPIEAAKLSFRGCLVNVIPFSVYGLAALGLSILAMIPMMLGFLVLGPVLVASTYVAYKEIFVAG